MSENEGKSANYTCSCNYCVLIFLVESVRDSALKAN